MAALEDGQITRFDAAGGPVAVVRVGGRLHAFQDVCSHQNCAFSEEGEIDAESVLYCLCHFSSFDLETGDALGGPADDPIRIYEVRLQDGVLHVKAG